MDVIEVLVPALVRGLAELLPVGPTEHLLVLDRLAGWTERGPARVAAAQAGVLAAVIAYFWRDAGRLAYGLASPLWGRFGDEARLFWNLVLATLPLFLAAFLLIEADAGGGVSALLLDPVVLAGAVILFALLLWLADALAPQTEQVREIGPLGALFVGLVQVLGLVPGVSRTGVAITAARLLGCERDEAARFALLLAIPVAAGTAMLAGRAAWTAAGSLPVVDMLVAAAAAFAAGLAGIALLMAVSRRGSFLPFVLYRLLLGALLVYWSY